MKTSKSKMIQTVISLLIMFVAGYFIPTWGPVTRMGVQYLCIMIGWIYMSIVTGGLLLSSVIALTACVIPGYYTAASIVSTTLGNSITLLMIFIFIMVYIFQKTQTGEFLVRWLPSLSVHRVLLHRHHCHRCRHRLLRHHPAGHRHPGRPCGGYRHGQKE